MVWYLIAFMCAGNSAVGCAPAPLPSNTFASFVACDEAGRRMYSQEGFRCMLGKKPLKKDAPE